MHGFLDKYLCMHHPREAASHWMKIETVLSACYELLVSLGKRCFVNLDPAVLKRFSGGLTSFDILDKQFGYQVTSWTSWTGLGQSGTNDELREVARKDQKRDTYQV